MVLQKMVIAAHEFYTNLHNANINNNNNNNTSINDDTTAKSKDELLLKNRVIQLISQLDAEMLGLNDLENDVAKFGKVYYRICEFEMFTCGIFGLRKGQSLIMHDHPSMTVFSRLMKGKILCQNVHVLSHTPDNSNGKRGVLKEKIVDAKDLIMAVCHVIEPERNNLHSITALEDAAFIDVLGPPYSPDRPCTFYAVETLPVVDNVDEANCIVRPIEHESIIEHLLFRGKKTIV